MDDRELEPSFEGDAPAAVELGARRDRRELALVAFERTRMPMVVSDPRQPDAPIVLANHAFLEMCGYTADEVIGRNCRFLQGPGTAPEAVAAIRQGLAAGDDHVSVELLNYRRDGTPFWNQLAISPVYDAQGALIYYFGSQKDVTARRRAEALEESERLLLHEVDHRANNSLAIVKSIVGLTKADSPAAYAASVQSRVDALARAHRLLARSGWTSSELADVLDMEIPSGFRGKVSLGGPSALLDAQLVQPVTLVMREMMANAVEHGSLRRGGTLRVTWQTEANGVTIQWCEQGQDPAPPVRAPGFGISIAKGVIERQLGGRLEMTWAPTGLDAIIAIPAGGFAQSR